MSSLFKAETNPKQLSPLTLAFLGDAVYALMVRNYVVNQGNMPTGSLHRASICFVSAKAQFQASLVLADKLTEDEMAIFKRGRNATGNHIPKNVNPGIYRAATGIEALFGYLYLLGSYDRLTDLFSCIISNLEQTEEKE